MNDIIFKLGRFFDHILSPPANYVNMTYEDRFHRHYDAFKSGRNRPVNWVHTVRFGFMLGLSYALTPVARLLKKSGYRFVDIDLRQIGSALFLDLLIRHDILDRETPRQKFFVLSSHYTDGNPYLFDLYKPYVTFVRNPIVKSLLSPFFVSPLFRDDSSYLYDTVLSKKPIAHDIWNRYAKKYGKPLIQFPHKDIPAVEERLRRYLPRGQKFVTLHVRDSGFYADTARTSRNSDINTYQSAVQYLIKRGYAVVRLGDPSAVGIERMQAECGPLLFDYAHSDIRSPMMDTYFLSECAFFFGGPSGPSSVPYLFGVSSCNVNWNNIINGPNFLAGDVTAFKKPRRKDGTLVPFEKLLYPPYSDSLTERSIEKYELTIEANTPDEILATMVEFLEGRDAQLTPLQRKAQDLYTPAHYSYGANGKLASVILKQYFP